MEGCTIIDYTDKWRNALREYLHNTFPDYSNDYIEYCLDHSLNSVPAKIVLNKQNQIVGCHLYYCTKTFLLGKEIDTQWGHDTFLDRKYRAEVGLDLMIAINRIKSFGLGLTGVAEQINRKFKNVFFKGVYNYYWINRRVFLSPFQKMFTKVPTHYSPDNIKIGKYTFKRVRDAKDITIPNDGYWFKNYRDIDFIRDAEFINERFIYSRVYHYDVFTLDEEGGSCYFVTRQSFYRGMPVLCLSDYRYCHDDSTRLLLIIKAVNKLAIESKLGIVLCVCGDHNMRKALRSIIHYSTPLLFMSSLRLKSDLSFIVTGGDSDADFLK